MKYCKDCEQPMIFGQTHDCPIRGLSSSRSTDLLATIHRIDIDSVRRAINGEEEPFLSDGYQWTDKPHRVMRAAMDELELLRKIIANGKDDAQ